MPGEYSDHYHTLGLAPGATPEQIKKAWRKLVLDLHPDKTGNDPALSVRFTAIQQAYEVLSDPLKKIQFLQERWLRKAQGQPNDHRIGNLAEWVKECLTLERRVNTHDPDQIDQSTLLTSIQELSRGEKLNAMQAGAYPEVLLTGARLLLQAGSVLTLYRYRKMMVPLSTIAPEDAQWQQEIQKGLLKKKRAHAWNRYRVAFLIILSILLCLLIAS